MLAIASIAVLLVLVVTVVAIVTTERSVAPPKRAAEAALQLLEESKVSVVEDAEAGQRVLEALDRLAVARPILGAALAEYSDTIVTVDGVPRRTLPLTTFLPRDAWILRHAPGRRFSVRQLMRTPDRVRRLAVCGAAFVLAVALAGPESPLEAGELVPVLQGLALPVAAAFGTFGVGWAACILVRWNTARALDELDEAILALELWFESRYRRVTAEELLARLLQREAR